MGFAQEVSLAYRYIQHVDRHLEARERCYGIRVPQTATEWMTEAALTPFRAISGNGVFGTDPNDEALVVGEDDTPIIDPGCCFYSLHSLVIAASSESTPYVLRFIYGMGTMAAAEAAGQYSDLVYVSVVTVGFAGGIKLPMMDMVIPNGTKLWCRAKNVTNNATIDFFVGLHGHLIDF